MPDAPPFDLDDFLPYLLNIAAEETAAGFASVYKARYGMLRTEWRVLFHLGRYGPMTAREISERARTHKTKVSRAVAALEARRFLTREEMEHDRRHERLSLTAKGRAAFLDLCGTARTYDAAVVAPFTEEEQAVLRACLRRLANFPTDR
ncbi:MarR family winged helix-turn-helix transcriptional regulator [Acuticoccus kandeliae]|uniref:MarR family winged helix-turn-helix transcriptional regulator n=1 Tax=Acuticoccus kandeliae TaxID=2073160 RepID=UPI000D3E1B11|nr:MarR family winged helix-turn-helix transcriptional regulator [Acuticoccus kandeliae]